MPPQGHQGLAPSSVEQQLDRLRLKLNSVISKAQEWQERQSSTGSVHSDSAPHTPLVNVGRHGRENGGSRVPRHPHHFQGHSEYTMEYPPKEVPHRPRASPDPVTPSTPFAGRSEYTGEYGPKSSEPRQRVPQHTSTGPSSPFVGTSEYTAGYPPQPVEARRPPPLTGTQSAKPNDPFQGRSEYEEEYPPKWVPHSRRTPEATLGTPQPFAGNSEYSTNYQPYAPHPRHRRTPVGPSGTPQPFAGVSEYEHEYPPKRGEPRNRATPTAAPTHTPFDGTSEYQMEYPERPLEPRAPGRAAGEPIGLPQPFSGTSEYEHEYPPKQVERPQRLPQQYEPSSVPFAGNSEYQTEFPEHPLQPRHPAHSGDGLGPPQPFEGRSEYEQEYGPKRGERPQRVPRRYEPNTVPFGGASEYQTEFPEHPLEPRRPAHSGESMGPSQPFEGRSEYEQEYGPKEGERPQRKPQQYEPNTVPFGGASEYQTEFPEHPLEPRRPAHSGESMGPSQPFEGRSEYEQEYGPKEGERPQRMPQQYEPNNTPFLGSSEYQTEFPEHPLEPRRPAHSGESMEPSQPFAGRSEYENEYGPKQGERPQRVPQRYEPNNTPFMGSSEYQTEFPEHPLQPRHPAHSGEFVGPSEPFVGRSEYEQEYGPKEGERPQRVPQRYEPNTVPFGGASEYQTEFPEHPLEPRRPAHSGESMGPSQPFEGRSEYEQEYGPKQGERPQRMPQQYEPNNTPFLGSSEYQTEFPEHPLEPRRPAHSGESMGPSQPFEGRSEYEQEYGPKEGERAQRKPQQYEPNNAPFLGSSEYQTEFPEHPLEPRRPAHSGESMGPSQPFEGRSEYEQEYGPKEGERPQRMPQQYEPNNAPFLGSSEYQTEFPEHPLEPRHPARGGQTMGLPQPFEGRSEYENEYGPKQGERPQRVPQRYEPNNTPFMGSSEYQTEFPEHAVEPRRPTRGGEPTTSPLPFRGRSEYEQEYGPKQGERAHRPLERYIPSTNPFQGASEYQSEFPEHTLSPTTRSRPDQTTVAPTPFEGRSEYEQEYGPKQGERTFRLPPQAHLQDRPFSGTSEYQSEFPEHWLEPRVPVHNESLGVTQRPFEGSSEYNNEFGPKRGEPRGTVGRPMTPSGSTGPFAGTSEYQSEFTPRRSESRGRPPPPLHHSESQPFQGLSEYNSEYVPRSDPSSMEGTHRVPHHHGFHGPSSPPFSIPFQGTSEYHSEFPEHIHEPRQTASPAPPSVPQQPFQGQTEYDAEFSPMPGRGPPSVDSRNTRGNTPGSATPVTSPPFGGVSEYQSEFTPSRQRRSSSTPRRAASSGPRRSTPRYAMSPPPPPYDTVSSPADSNSQPRRRSRRGSLASTASQGLSSRPDATAGSTVPISVASTSGSTDHGSGFNPTIGTLLYDTALERANRPPPPPPAFQGCSEYTAEFNERPTLQQVPASGRPSGAVSNAASPLRPPPARHAFQPASEHTRAFGGGGSSALAISAATPAAGKPTMAVLMRSPTQPDMQAFPDIKSPSGTPTRRASRDSALRRSRSMPRHLDDPSRKLEFWAGGASTARSGTSTPSRRRKSAAPTSAPRSVPFAGTSSYRSDFTPRSQSHTPADGRPGRGAVAAPSGRSAEGPPSIPFVASSTYNTDFPTRRQGSKG